MNWITDKIAIGNYLDAQDIELIKEYGIRSVVCLDGSLRSSHAAALELSEVAAYQLIDGAGNDLRIIRFAVDDLIRLVESNPPVLVHCHAGRSRSAVVVAAYIMKVQGLSADDALALVAAKREISVTPGLEEILYRLEA